MQEQAAVMGIEEMLQYLTKNKIYGEELVSRIDDDAYSNWQKYQLRIFVSSSMGIELLKSYAESAEKFGGILVFKGLPDSSFRSLQKLVMGIEGEKDIDKKGSNIQLDQESFEEFDVKLVPTIVLSKEENCFTKQSCKRSFDKIVGNIGVEFALRQFADHGDLREIALRILK